MKTQRPSTEFCVALIRRSHSGDVRLVLARCRDGLAGTLHVFQEKFMLHVSDFRLGEVRPAVSRTFDGVQRRLNLNGLQCLVHRFDLV